MVLHSAYEIRTLFSYDTPASKIAVITVLEGPESPRVFSHTSSEICVTAQVLRKNAPDMTPDKRQRALEIAKSLENLSYLDQVDFLRFEEKLKKIARAVPANFERAINSALQSRCDTARQHKAKGGLFPLFTMHGDGYWLNRPGFSGGSNS
jgi:hypothetical protein